VVSELSATAAGMGFLVLRGSCFETDRASPYSLFLDLFRSSFAEPSASIPDGDLPPLAHHLSLAMRQATAQVLDRDPLGRSPVQGPPQEQLRLFADVLRFVSERAAERPLLLILEDLHWSDETSLALLRDCFESLPR